MPVNLLNFSIVTDIAGDSWLYVVKDGVDKRIQGSTLAAQIITGTQPLHENLTIISSGTGALDISGIEIFLGTVHASFGIDLNGAGITNIGNFTFASDPARVSARVELGLQIGVDVQAQSATLALLAPISTEAYGRNFLALGDNTAALTHLGLSALAYTDVPNSWSQTNTFNDSTTFNAGVTFGASQIITGNGSELSGFGNISFTGTLTGGFVITKFNFVEYTATHTLVAADVGKYVQFNSASPVDFEIEDNATASFAVGCSMLIRQVGAGQVTIVATAGVTINTSQTLKLRAQHSTASLTKIATDEWDLAGDLEPV